MGDCLNCTHPEAHHDPYGCYTFEDGTRAPELSRRTCRCGFYAPPGEPEPAEEPEPDPEPVPDEEDEPAPDPAPAPAPEPVEPEPAT